MTNHLLRNGYVSLGVQDFNLIDLFLKEDAQFFCEIRRSFFTSLNAREVAVVYANLSTDILEGEAFKFANVSERR